MGNMRQEKVVVKRNTKKDQWLRVLLAGVFALVLGNILPCMVLAEISRDVVSDVNTNMAGIPTGPGQVCVKYTDGYGSLADWVNGPIELNHYAYISYDDVKFFATYDVCIGAPPYPGTLPEGNFFLLGGGLIKQAEIVNIERVEPMHKCSFTSYILTFYRFTNPVSIPDPSGTCVKGIPPDKNKNQGPSETCQ